VKKLMLQMEGDIHIDSGSQRGTLVRLTLKAIDNE